MRLWLATGLVCATLVVDSTAVSSLGISEQERPAHALISRIDSAPAQRPAPMVLLVTGTGETVAGMALTAQ